MITLTPYLAAAETGTLKQLWSNNLSLDTNFTWRYTGHDSLRTLSLNTDNFYWGDRWELAFTGNQNRNHSGTDSLNLIQGQANINRYLTDRLFVLPWAAGLHISEHSAEATIAQLGAGAGWALVKKQNHHLEIMAAMVKSTLVVGAPGVQRQDSPAVLIATRWQKKSRGGIGWLFQGLYACPTNTEMRRQMNIELSVGIPIAGPLTANVHVHDYTSPFASGILSLKGLTVSTGFGVHFN